MSQPTAAAPVTGGPPQQQQQRVPLSKEKNPVAIKLAGALRYNTLLKQRQGILNDTKNHADFFRFKRFIRALQSDEYKKLQAKNPKELPLVTADPASIQQIFILLIQNQIIVPVIKLKTADAKAKGIKVDKNTPGLVISNKAIMQPDAYFAWNYTPPNPYLALYSVLAIVLVFTVILFPLWPLWMRRGVWYLSTGLLGLICVFFGIAVIRLIIYLITLATMKNQFWLFPNLFEDCGVLESFQPFYAWEDAKATKKGKKSQKKISQVNDADAIPATTNTTTSSAAHATTNTTKSRAPKLEDVPEK